MSRVIIVLLPNGRRHKIQCSPDTSILQILEEVCRKHDLQATNYDLKHHKNIMDLTSTIRFSNLPNKATLEMVELEKQRHEANVTVGLILEDGDRRTDTFNPNMSLYNLVQSLAPAEMESMNNPTILYMRQEVIGESALKSKTLRQLGLIGGRAILRLLNKPQESVQANVSAVYGKQIENKKEHSLTGVEFKEEPTESNESFKSSYASKSVQEKDFIDISETINESSTLDNEANDQNKVVEYQTSIINDDMKNTVHDLKSENLSNQTTSKTSLITQANLERRLKIEEEVTFIGAQRAIAFMQPDINEEELEDLPDDFYELTIEEVRKLYNDLQNRRLEMENTPLISANKREEIQKNSQAKLNVYKNVVVRVQFPDRLILQGIFSPSDTIEDVHKFISSHLKNPEKEFHIFTTPFKENLDRNMTLAEAKFVPCVHMHFKWLQDNMEQPYLKEEIYEKQTSSDAASILASKYRAPNRRKIDHASENSQLEKTSTNQNSKIPKWFKK